MPRYLGIDYGIKRIGLAISDADARLAMPLKQILSRGSADADAEQLRTLISDYQVEALVVGLPLNMDGSTGPQAQLTRQYGEALADALKLPVDFWDERLSSCAADSLLDQRSHLTRRQRRARRDALAAQTVLQAFLDARDQAEAR